jgi:hypothetical protein
MASIALAQQPPIVIAEVEVLMTDPAGGDPWTITDTFAVTYPGMTSCEAQVPNIQNSYIRRVANVELLTPSGVPPVVEVEVNCVQQR